MKYILQCPRCKDVIHWERKSDSDGPGHCHCGAYAAWNVLKDDPQECPLCGGHHSDWFCCEDEMEYYYGRDWGDL